MMSRTFFPILFSFAAGRMFLTTYNFMQGVMITILAGNEVLRNHTQVEGGGALFFGSVHITTEINSNTTGLTSSLESMLHSSAESRTRRIGTNASSTLMVISGEALATAYYSPPSVPGDGRTTIIVCSNLIPSHPSIWMINRTIESVHQYLIGLEPDYKLIVTLDGVNPTRKLNVTRMAADRLRLDEYVQRLTETFPRVQIVGGYTINNTYIGLSQNVMAALNVTDTEFMYLVQHDMPFIKEIQHVALTGMARDVADRYPFNVRFNKNLHLLARKSGKCFNASHQLSFHHKSGLRFVKTSFWSDK